MRICVYYFNKFFFDIFNSFTFVFLKKLKIKSLTLYFYIILFKLKYIILVNNKNIKNFKNFLNNAPEV